VPLHEADIQREGRKWTPISGLAQALLSWIVAQDIGTALIEPGKLWQNGVAASFNGKIPR